jgi:UDP-N-acetylglucosamine transferase subunit ALG13
LILCLVGTNPYSFERLVKEVDKIADKYKIFIQIGNTKYIPKNCEFIDFEENSKLQEKIKNADLIITQGGYGSMMDAIQLHKKIIAVPRKIDLNESLDDQTELIEYFESKNYVLSCYDIAELEGLVKVCLSGEIKFKKYVPESVVKISDKIEEYLQNV